mgnify:CR=1 FL=1
MERLQILEQIERFDEELAREGLAHSVGLKDTINTSAIFDKYNTLFSASNIKLLKALFDGAMMPGTKRKNLLLYDYLVSPAVSSLESVELEVSGLGPHVVVYFQLDIIASSVSTRMSRREASL